MNTSNKRIRHVYVKICLLDRSGKACKAITKRNQIESLRASVSICQRETTKEINRMKQITVFF